MILDHSRIMLNVVGCYVVREVTLFRSWGPVLFAFPFDLGRVVYVTLMNVAHVPGLSRNLLSLRRIADAGNKYVGTREGIRVVFAKSHDEVFAPS